MLPMSETWIVLYILVCALFINLDSFRDGDIHRYSVLYWAFVFK